MKIDVTNDELDFLTRLTFETSHNAAWTPQQRQQARELWERFRQELEDCCLHQENTHARS